MQAMISPSLSRATLDMLQRHAPFDGMAREHLMFMIERMQLAFYAAGTIITDPQQGRPRWFYVIKQGKVTAEQAGEQAGEQTGGECQPDGTHLELTEGECFPLGALLTKRPVTSVYCASQDTFCYQLPAGDFEELLGLSPEFRDFCTRRIANLLERSQKIIQAQFSQKSTDQQSLTSPLHALLRRAPVSCTPDTPIQAALELMQKHGIGSMIVVQNTDRPVGIFTLHDLLRITIERRDTAEPISDVMSVNLITLPPQATAYDAALAMAKHGIRHVLIAEHGRLVGIISEKDLFSLQQVGITRIGDTIRRAQGLNDLRLAAGDIRSLTHNMLAQGVAADHLTEIVSTLNDRLTRRIIQIECHAADIPEDEFCWMALGSEGRLEQTLSSDQDNAIVFPTEDDADLARARLLPVAQRVNQTLDACGFPLCKGQIMAGNPRWCLSLAEWKHTFSGWIELPTAQALLHSAIFFDFRPLFGNVLLAEELRKWLNHAVAAVPRFLHQMVANALLNRPPLGVVRDFVVSGDSEHPHTIDLKMHGAAPFVDAARIYALMAGVSQTNTIERLRAAGAVLGFRASEVDAWAQAFSFIQLLRLRHQHWDGEKRSGNRVDPNELNELDRRILKESFRQARKLQTKLALAYNLYQRI